jgi:RNA methyltransferase, TrmH family
LTADLPLLDNPRSDRVRQVAALGRRAVRRRTGRFLVEGPQAVRELLVHACDHAEAVYLTAEAADRHADLVDVAAAGRVRLQHCTPQVLAAMADTPHPQGVVAVAREVGVDAARALEAAGRSGYVVVLANVRDPGNAGTVIRGADAFGAAAVLVSEASVDVYNPKVVRSTVGALFHLPVSTGTPLPDLLRLCKEAGLRLLAADGTGQTMLPDADLSTPHAWVLGNEAQGLGEDVLRACDQTVAVPIVRVESLNLAMAATVCLHASAAARRSA